MKSFLMACALLLAGGIAEACPICGCGGGNLYTGLLPAYQKGFFGMRYHYGRYHSQLVDDPDQFSTNYYNTIELWGGLRLGNRFQLMAFVPYYQNKQIDDDGVTRPSGLGDITVLGQYLAFSRYKGSGKSAVKQELWLGGGLKVPTGGFHLDESDPDVTVADINAQLGTGSVDFLVSGLYTLSAGDWGLNATANYKLNTTNSDRYRYGNRFSGNLLTYYHLKSHKTGITPNVGVGYENVAANTLKGSKVEFTGSHEMTAIAGLEFAFGRIGVGANLQLPLEQNFAEGQTKMEAKAMAHVTYAF